MLNIEIPGFGHVVLEHLVTDFTGTLSVDGGLLPGVKERLNRLSGQLRLHVLTSDTFGTAAAELAGIDCELHILSGEDHDIQKETYVRKLGADKVASFGNGKNDTRMLRLARLGIAVMQAEGLATAALIESDIMVGSIVDGLDILIYTRRAVATLRF